MKEEVMKMLEDSKWTTTIELSDGIHGYPIYAVAESFDNATEYLIFKSDKTDEFGNYSWYTTKIGYNKTDSSVVAIPSGIPSITIAEDIYSAIKGFNQVVNRLPRVFDTYPIKTITLANGNEAEFNEDGECKQLK